MEIIRPRTLPGFMELLPAKQAQFEKMLEILRSTYASFGFAPLDTPVIEDAQILLAKGGGETEKQIYRFQKGDSDLALRFDLTVPLAKYVALHYNDLAFPFRRYQISKVYRGERPQRGRFREFYQADIDIIGDGKLDVLNEAEIPAVIYRIFRAFGLTRFQVRVNNRKILTGFYEMLGLAAQSAEIMRTVDKLDKIGAEKVRLLLTEDCGVEPNQAEEILRFISISGANSVVLAALGAYQGKNECFDLGVSELKTVTENLAAFGVPEENFAIDLTIARGLDYYTGTVYETTLLDHPEIGSVCSGGRYDNLASHYIDKPLPGVGISIGLTRLFYVLDEQGLLNPSLCTAPADALVLPMTADPAPAIVLAEQLRGAGLRVQLYAEQKKFKQKLSYADKLGAPFAVLLGEDELAEGLCSVKDMRSGVQKKLAPAEAAAYMRSVLAAEQGALILEQSHGE
ncbi:MAG: histidine--tRNA ligase [Firmicutes bacterium]|nr:histidine--tRNA ligase [Bacillota bacterium]